MEAARASLMEAERPSLMEAAAAVPGFAPDSHTLQAKQIVTPRQTQQ